MSTSKYFKHTHKNLKPLNICINSFIRSIHSMKMKSDLIANTHSYNRFKYQNLTVRTTRENQKYLYIPLFLQQKQPTAF